ncbi:Imm50 family immunity protein, partial [Pseudomonas putida]
GGGELIGTDLFNIIEQPHNGKVTDAESHYFFRKKMKYWNELYKNIFFERIFSQPVEIGKITLFSLQIDNDRPSLGLGFDIPEFPDILPEKWKNKGYNVCRLGIDCHGISGLKILNIPDKDSFYLRIKKQDGRFCFKAINENSLIEFQAQSISICDPNVYIKGNDEDF